MASTLPPGGTGNVPRLSIAVDLKALQAAPAVAAAAAKGVSKEIAAAMREAAAAQKVAVANAQAALAAVRGQQAQATAATRAAATQQQQAAIQQTATVRAQLTQQTAAHRAAMQQQTATHRAALQAQAAAQRAAQRGQGGGLAAQIGRGIAGALVPLGGLALGAATVGAVGAGARASFDAAKDAAFAERSAVAFDKLSGSAARANANLAAVQQGAAGTLSRVEAMRIGVQSMALGLAKTGEEFKNLASAARAVSFVSPVIHDVSSAISEIALASANMSFRRLDQLGLTSDEVRDKMEELRKTQGDLNENQLFAQAVIETLNTKYKTLLETTGDAASAYEKATARAEDARIAFGNAIQPATIAAVDAYSASLLTLAGIFDALNGKKLGLGRYTWSGPDVAARAAAARAQIAGGQTMAQRIDATDERAAAAVDWARQTQAIERSANAARIDETRSFERQRAQTIEQYALANTREEEDFQRSRFRAAQNLAKSIQRVGRDAAEREAEMVEERDKRIAKIRAEAEERIVESERDYAKDRERAARDHRDKLLDAAARLDAAAVFEEQKRFSRESQDAEEDHKEKISKEREQLQERIHQENEAHAERLEDARKADARRIEDMRESLEEQQRIEDEDRAIRKDRQAADFARQLSQMDEAHAERLDQINRHAAEERIANDEAFQKRMAELGIQNAAYAKLMETRERLAIDAAGRFFDAIEKRLAPIASARARQAAGAGPQPSEYASGGYVPNTGMAKLHAGEYVMTARETAVAMRNGGFPGAGANNSRSITVAPGAIVVHAAPGMDEAYLAEMVQRQFIATLEQLS